MTLVTLVYRSLRQHALSTLVTSASIALACGLLIVVWVVKTESQAAFTKTGTSYDAVLGARGSKLQLVLNAIFHLEASPGNIAWADYEQLKRHPAVKAAVPIALGDNYEGWRIVGTLPELFARGEKSAELMGSGRLFEETKREAVVGSFAAQRLGWRVGDTFKPYHGLAYDPGAQHEEVFTIVGILAPTNTPTDRVIWIPLKGVQTMSGHDPKAATEVSAVLVTLRAASAGAQLDWMYNKQGNRLTFAWPAATMVAELFSKIGWFDRVLTWVAYLVGLVAAGSVLASIQASMHARRRDVAILRALGAGRRVVAGMIIAEAATIGLIGAVAGVILYYVTYAVLAGLIQAKTGVALDPWQWHWAIAWAPGGLVALAALGGVLPALKAYRVSVAEALLPES